MLKRVKFWTYLTAAFGASLFQFGCGWWPYGQGVNSIPRVIAQILREDLFG